MRRAPTTRDDIVKELAVASLSGTLVLFVGSGFSKALTKGAAPTWGQLLQAVAAELDLADPLQDPAKIVGSSFPRIAAEMASQLARNVIATEPRFRDASSLERHAEAVRRIKLTVASKTTLTPDTGILASYREALGKLQPRAVVTTNYDFVVEACLEHAEALLPDQVVRARQGCIPVIHLHGHILHPDSIVLLEGDYVRALNHSEYRHVRLGVLFAESTTLMIGYALGDVNVQTALHYAGAYRNPSSELSSGDVGRLVFLSRNAPPLAAAREEPTGELVIEDVEILNLLAAVVQQRDELANTWDSVRKAVAEFAGRTDAHNTFASSSSFRVSFIKAAREIPALLSGNDAVAFVQQALGPVAQKAFGKDGWPHYKLWLDAVLDILEHWPLGTIPPLLFEYVAKELGSLAYYIEPSGQQKMGYAWGATALWIDRKASVFGGKPALVAALRNYAARHGAPTLTALLEGS